MKLKITFPQLDMFSDKLDKLQATLDQLAPLAAKESSDMSQVSDALKTAVATLKQSEADEVARYEAILTALKANSSDPAVQTEITNIQGIIDDLNARAGGSPVTTGTPTP